LAVHKFEELAKNASATQGNTNKNKSHAKAQRRKGKTDKQIISQKITKTRRGKIRTADRSATVGQPTE
jgi:hypothetical protein